jgi:hypothetical protein
VHPAIIGAIIGAVVLAVIYALRQRSKKDEVILGKLRTHFGDMKREVIDPIIGKTAKLHINSGGRLVFGDDSRVNPKYRFEESDLYTCFKAHFPQETEQWKTFKKEASGFSNKYHSLPDIKRRLHELKRMQAHQRPENWVSERERYERESKEMSRAFHQETEELVNECSDFSKQLSSKVENITKYGMGKDFKKVKSCPICKKF